MRANANLVIRGRRVALVPYRREHVIAYHEWMQDPQLQESTASDPLTLKEEYQMQRTWAEDEDKCTFILLDPVLEETPGTEGHGGGMVGDVNLFLNDPEDRSTAEIEVMIAEPQSRGKGLAFEALVLLMLYGTTTLGLKKYVAKIGFGNAPSQRLFSKLGFSERSRSNVFHEVTFALDVNEAVAARLTQLAPDSVRYEPYD